jgi:DTW domain-containing protein
MARPTCPRCRRPLAVCYCAALVSLETRTRVVLLQHPRERRVPIGTARIAHLCLPGSELHVGVDFESDPGVRAALDRKPTYLLFPGPDATDLDELLGRGPAPSGPITLVVVDGTWWLARKLLKLNPSLAALPQIRFTPAAPSRYHQIRREPAGHCVATIEALAEVLGRLEGDMARFQSLLRPFERMVDTQVHFATHVRGARARHARHRTRRAQRAAVPSLSAPTTAPLVLRARAGDVVCVQGEANAWPARRPGGHPPEIVHWVARRAATGETFEAIIAPRNPLSPAIPGHIGIPRERLAAGESWTSFQARWSAFARPDDLICAWGRFPMDLLEKEGVALPPARLDVRPVASAFLGARPGTIEACTDQLGVAPLDPFAAGRGGARLAALCSIVNRMMH